MNPIGRYLLLALLAAALAFGLTYVLLTAPESTAEVDELVWMQKEFHLTAAQTAAIQKLHTEYEPICMDHCQRVMDARKALVSASDKTAAHAELARLEAVCQDATRAHLKRVAAVMSPDQGARFLSLVEPKVSGQTHSAPVGLK